MKGRAEGMRCGIAEFAGSAMEPPASVTMTLPQAVESSPYYSRMHHQRNVAAIAGPLRVKFSTGLPDFIR